MYRPGAPRTQFEAIVFSFYPQIPPNHVCEWVLIGPTGLCHLKTKICQSRQPPFLPGTLRFPRFANPLFRVSHWLATAVIWHFVPSELTPRTASVAGGSAQPDHAAMCPCATPWSAGASATNATWPNCGASGQYPPRSHATVLFSIPEKTVVTFI